jgi:signal peptidase I
VSTAVADARDGTKSRRGKWWENVKSIAITVAIFLVFRAFLIEAYRIPSGSMVPTLLIADWLFVNKLRYGPHIPFTKWNLPGYAEPKVGEVAVFESPYQPDLGPDEDRTPTLVKRIQGGPGDTLYMRDGLLYRNGEPRPLPHRVDTMGVNTHHYDALFDWQHQYELKVSRFPAPPEQPNLDNWGPLVIPPEHYFMMGDARYDSKDSRYWGLVPRRNFRGRPLFIYYSFRPKGESDRPLSFLTDIRWGRIGHIIR